MSIEEKINKLDYPLLEKFVPHTQLEMYKRLVDLLMEGRFVEDGESYLDRLLEVQSTILKMPHTFQQDGKGDEAIAYLHYFTGSSDWYITEKDVNNPLTEVTERSDICEQIQASGLECLNCNIINMKLGYIPIQELCRMPMVELDFYFAPLSVLKAKEEIGLKLDAMVDSVESLLR